MDTSNTEEKIQTSMKYVKRCYNVLEIKDM